MGGGIFFFSGLFFFLFWERGFLGLFFFWERGFLGEGVLDYFFLGEGMFCLGFLGLFFFWERGFWERGFWIIFFLGEGMFCLGFLGLFFFLGEGVLDPSSGLCLLYIRAIWHPMHFLAGLAQSGRQ